MYCKVKAMVGHPTKERLNLTVSSKLLNNYLIKVEDVTNAHTIFGKYLAGVRVKKQRDIN